VRLHLGLAGTLALGYPTGCFPLIFTSWLWLGIAPLCSLADSSATVSPVTGFFFFLLETSRANWPGEFISCKYLIVTLGCSFT